MPAFTGRASGLPLVARARPFTQGTARHGLPLPSRAEHSGRTFVGYSILVIGYSIFVFSDAQVGRLYDTAFNIDTDSLWPTGDPERVKYS